MTRWTATKATVAGVCVFVLGQILYVWLAQYELLRLVLLGTPGFAAFVAAYFSPRWKMAVGMSMAIYSAVLGELMAVGYAHFGGHVDQIGGVSATIAILLAYHSAFSFVGCVAGIALSNVGPKGAE